MQLNCLGLQEDQVQLETINGKIQASLKQGECNIPAALGHLDVLEKLKVYPLLLKTYPDVVYTVKKVRNNKKIMKYFHQYLYVCK